LTYKKWINIYRELILHAIEQASAYGYYGDDAITALEICNTNTSSNMYEEAIQDFNNSNLIRE